MIIDGAKLSDCWGWFAPSTCDRFDKQAEVYKHAATTCK
jgi:hypothetical protein